MHGDGFLWPMGGMMVGWLLLTLLLIALVVWLVVSYTRPRGDIGATSAAHETSSARRILAERYARGELDTDEFAQRRSALG